MPQRLRGAQNYFGPTAPFAGFATRGPGTSLDVMTAKTPMNDTVSRALTEILAQHEELRILMDRCDMLADEVDAGRGSVETLVTEVARVRVALEHHNQAEEHVLRPILRAADTFTDVRIERMVADHVDEHRALRDRLATGPTAELRATLASLRDHLETEERLLARRLPSPGA
jgi:Tfp pilus assembly pilus retraction ATPase PilT